MVSSLSIITVIVIVIVSIIALIISKSYKHEKENNAIIEDYIKKIDIAQMQSKEKRMAILSNSSILSDSENENIKNSVNNTTELDINPNLRKNSHLTLHDAIIMALKQENRALNAMQIAEIITNNKTYLKSNGTPPSRYQITARINNKQYSHLFTKDDSIPKLYSIKD